MQIQRSQLRIVLPLTVDATPVLPFEPIPTGHATDLPCPTAVFHAVLDCA